MKREQNPEVLTQLARKVSGSGTGDQLLGARAARALGVDRLTAPYLADIWAAEALVAASPEGGYVVGLEKIDAGGSVTWRAVLADAEGSQFRPGVFGLAGSRAQAVVAAALRRAAVGLRAAA